MIRFDQWALPDGETHLQGWMLKVNRRVEGRLTYQYHKYEAALKFCRERRACCDVGAHAGLFAYWMARDFQAVHAFEPVAAHRECFAANVFTSDVSGGNVTLHDCALGERDGMVAIHTNPTSSGDSWVDGAGEIPMKRLDSFGLQEVGFVKIDVEGGEEAVIRGGLETIKRCRPVMIVEQKGHAAPHFGLQKEGAIRLLESIGMKALCPPMSGDWILGWP